MLAGIGYGVYRWMQPDEPVAPAMVAVPTVLTYTEDQATARLEGVGLKAEVRSVNGSADTKGQVTQQDPIADTQVEVGSTVTITVNQGPGDRRPSPTAWSARTGTTWRIGSTTPASTRSTRRPPPPSPATPRPARC